MTAIKGLSDALPKRRGLAEFAQSYGDAFHRIEAIAKIGDQLRVLDLKEANIQDAIKDAPDAESLYAGEAANSY